MNKQQKYSKQIHDVSLEATRFMSAVVVYLGGLLHAPSPAKRGASVCLLRDFARGELPTMPQQMQLKIVQQLEARLAVETDPFLRELIVRELALLLEPDCESSFVHLDPSEN